MTGARKYAIKIKFHRNWNCVCVCVWVNESSLSLIFISCKIWSKIALKRFRLPAQRRPRICSLSFLVHYIFLYILRACVLFFGLWAICGTCFCLLQFNRFVWQSGKPCWAERPMNEQLPSEFRSVTAYQLASSVRLWACVCMCVCVCEGHVATIRLAFAWHATILSHKARAYLIKCQETPLNHFTNGWVHVAYEYDGHKRTERSMVEGR